MNDSPGTSAPAAAVDPLPGFDPVKWEADQAAANNPWSRERQGN
jgi:hypothetical protein